MLGGGSEERARLAEALFPFPPYTIQRDFVSRFAEFTKGKEDGASIGILESPTGTGKTASLLCSALAWILKDDLEGEEEEEEEKRVINKKTGKVMDKEMNKPQPTQNIIESRQMHPTKDHSTMDNLIQTFQKEQGNGGGEGEKWNLPDSTNDEPEWIRQARKEYKNNNISPDLDALCRSRVQPKRRRLGNDDNRVRNKTDSILDESLRRLLSAAAAVSDEEEESPMINRTRKVYFCSRTHSQLSQVMAELKMILKTVMGRKLGERYVERLAAVRAITLSSRKNVCINDAVRRLESGVRINEKCQELVQGLIEDSCPFYNSQKDAVMRRLTETLDRLAVADVEDCVRQGRQLEACAYYATRSQVCNSDIITVPYNMILQKSARDSFELDLKGALIIFDEAHNLVDVINKINSCNFALVALVALLAALRRYADRFERRLSAENFILVQQLMQICSRIHDLCQRAIEGAPQGAKIWEVNEFLSGCEIDHINLIRLAIKVRTNGLSQKDHVPSETPNSSLLLEFCSLLESLSASDQDGRVYLEVTDANSPRIRYISLNAARSFKEITDEAAAVILAGGTIKPIEDALTQLFQERQEQVHVFSCGHLVPRENCLTIALQSGISSNSFRFTMENRDNLAMICELGQVLVNFCNVIPDGIACFFPSYQFLEKFQSLLPERTLKSIEQKKKIFVEDRTSSTPIETLLAHYQHAIKARSLNDRVTGALLFAVIGGRLSEGINFADQMARGVIIVGMPYPNIHDVETQERAAYFSRLKGQPDAKNEYLENACMRAVNQTIGRAIRHKDDYAAIVLIDERYGQARIRNKLPNWATDNIYPPAGNLTDFGDCFAKIVQFFKTRSRNKK